MTAVARPHLGYRYLAAIPAFSAGAAAQDGYAIGRLEFAVATPLEPAFAALDRWLAAEGLRATALVAAHLRSPAPFDDDGFSGINDTYQELLAERGILDGEANPVARSNVAAAAEPPTDVVLQSAFVVVPAAGASGDFVVAGAAETIGGEPATAAVVALGDTSGRGLCRKVGVVLQTMRARLAGLGKDGADPGHINVYTVHEIEQLQQQIAAQLPAAHAVGYQRWHSYPPVVGMEFEMDLHRVSWTRVIGR